MLSKLNMENPKPRVIAWELTRSCNLACAHCRASASYRSYSGELATEECYRLIDDISSMGRPILVLTGGEPLLRDDFFSIAGYAARKGLRVALGSNGTLLDQKLVDQMKLVSISRLGVSLDFPTAELHDQFRGIPGSFVTAVKGIELARQAGIETQINCTITKLNVQYVEELLALALKLKVVAFHPFLLVPTGRGKELEKEELSPLEYEHILRWVYRKQKELWAKMFFKPTDAPHYMRVVLQENKKTRREISPVNFSSHHRGTGDGLSSISRGCLAGVGFCFISHIGQVQGCGFLTVPAGNVREESFSHIWHNSPLFQELRDLSRLKGKCGICRFKEICGGCRARAYEATGDYLAAEPYCIYQPAAKPKSTSPVSP